MGQRTSNAITTLNLQNQPVVRTETYTYDELSRLKTADYGDGQTQGYSFDAIRSKRVLTCGNRLSKTDNVTGGETYAFDAANRIATRQVGTSAVRARTAGAVY